MHKAMKGKLPLSQKKSDAKKAQVKDRDTIGLLSVMAIDDICEYVHNV